MTSHLSRRLLAIMCVTALLGPVGALATETPPSPPWWKSETIRKELGLTADQSARIDTIWQATLPELRQDWEELDRLESKMSRLIETDAPEAQIVRLSDKVEALRSTLNKTRTLMLYRMRQVLTPEQRAKLKTYEPRKGGSPKDPHRSSGRGHSEQRAPDGLRPRN
jgi:Spy/CpxP family protein refolding chaperone